MDDYCFVRSCACCGIPVWADGSVITLLPRAEVDNAGYVRCDPQCGCRGACRKGKWMMRALLRYEVSAPALARDRLRGRITCPVCRDLFGADGKVMRARVLGALLRWCLYPVLWRVFIRWFWRALEHRGGDWPPNWPSDVSSDPDCRPNVSSDGDSSSEEDSDQAGDFVEDVVEDFLDLGVGWDGLGLVWD